MNTAPESGMPQAPFLWTRGVAARETLYYLDKGVDACPAILALATAPLTQLVAILASTLVLIAVAFADTARQTDRPAVDPL